MPSYQCVITLPRPLLNTHAHFSISASSKMSRNHPYQNKVNERNNLNVVITGSTKGIGKALASKYYKQGANVIINSRNPDRVNSICEELLHNENGTDNDKHHKNENWIYGIAADVSKVDDVKFMILEISKVMPTIDLWINNAGTCTYRRQSFLKFNIADMNTIVSTNLLGIMYCCRLTIPIMQKQSTGGHVINVIGAGSNGQSTCGYSVYGATKSAITQFTRTLVEENKTDNEINESNVGIHILSPGMVETDLIMSSADTDPILKEVIDMMCDKPDIVAEEIIEKIDAQILVPNAKHTVINILTPCKVVSKIINHHLHKLVTWRKSHK